MTYAPKQLLNRLATARKIADGARLITLPAFKSDITADNKNANSSTQSEFDPVTKTDITTEKFLREKIENAFPDDGIYGEELRDKPANNHWTWTLDPIDGTRGFVAGVPFGVRSSLCVIMRSPSLALSICLPWMNAILDV